MLLINLLQSNINKMLKKISAEVSSVKDLRNRAKPMYHEIGLGKVVGVCILVGYFTVLPAFLRLIWPWLFAEFEITTVYVGSVFVLNIGIFSAYNAILAVIYHIKHPFFEQYKNTSKPWPWEEDPQEWKSLRAKSFKAIFINFLVVTPVMVYISIMTSLPYEFAAEKWPSCFELIWQFTFFLIVQDILFYLSHLLLHQPKWYWIHKWHHEYRQTVSLAAHYVHPIEYVLSGTLPTSMGFQMLSFMTPVHYSTVLVWLIYRIIQSYEGHCGYTWTWNTLSLFPYTVGSDYHDFHHAMNAGNYGSVFIFCDALFGTEAPFLKFLKEQANQKQKSG